MTEPARPLVHATCVAFDVGGRGWVGALLVGPSGSGKSDLALRLVHEAGDETCRLVADDYVHLSRDGARVIAAAPAALRGKLEVRGLGIVELAFVEEAPLVVAFRLVGGDEVPRLPEPEAMDFGALAPGVGDGVRLPIYPLVAFEASATAKVVLASRRAAGRLGLTP